MNKIRSKKTNFERVVAWIVENREGGDWDG